MSLSRRKFVENAAWIGAGLTIVPRHVLGQGKTPPSDKLNIAAIGVGGIGRSNMLNAATENIVAMCDVDWDFANVGLNRLTADIERQQQRLNGTAEGAPLT